MRSPAVSWWFLRWSGPIAAFLFGLWWLHNALGWGTGYSLSTQAVWGALLLAALTTPLIFSRRVSGDIRPGPYLAFKRSSPSRALAVVCSVATYLLFAVATAYGTETILTGLFGTNFPENLHAWFGIPDTFTLGLCIFIWLAFPYPFARAVYALLRYRWVSAERPICPACDYELTGNVSGQCPECGEVIRLAHRIYG